MCASVSGCEEMPSDARAAGLGGGEHAIEVHHALAVPFQPVIQIEQGRVCGGLLDRGLSGRIGDD